MSIFFPLKIIRDNLSFKSKPSAVAIGNFDGLHAGHQKIITKIVANQNNLIPTVVTFEPPPTSVLQKSDKTRICSFRLKMELLASFGVVQVLALRFNKEFASLSAKSFIDHYLIEMLNAKLVVVGQDFEFGFKRQGNTGLLAQSALQYGFDFESVDVGAPAKVSSTAIRQALRAGDLSCAHNMLTRNYTLVGRVARGRRLGHQLGVPTANLNIKMNACLVRGVFVTHITVNFKHYFGVANIGVRPTVDGQRLIAEAHLFDCNENLYGKMMKMEILHKLRDEVRFENIDALKTQIFKDIEDAKEFLSKAFLNDRGLFAVSS